MEPLTAADPRIIKALPNDHVPYTDKYFLRTNYILQKTGINPRVSMKVFIHGRGKVAGLYEAVEVLTKFSDLADQRGEVWVTRKKAFEPKEPLIIIKGPIQSFIELETMYLGVLSHAISEASGIPAPDLALIKQKMKRLKAIYESKSIIYFGARHYHWSLDREIAAAVLSGGADQTSTDIGSSNIGKKGVGTMPHVLALVLAPVYGKETATLKSAELFDKFMPKEIPRITLIDTFNRELTDSLMVAKYFGKRKNFLRIDTCGENLGECGTLYKGRKVYDPAYQIGSGVTVELAKNLRMHLINNGFGDYTDLFLSSGFGGEKKALVFVKADKAFKNETGYHLFTGVGIGEVSKSLFATADICEIDGKPLAKTGREVESIDYGAFHRVI